MLPNISKALNFKDNTHIFVGSILPNAYAAARPEYEYPACLIILGFQSQGYIHHSSYIPYK